MAIHGRKGVVKVSNQVLGEVTAWSYEQTIDTHEKTSMSTSATDKSYLSGWVDGSGTIDFRFSDDAADNHDDIPTVLEAGNYVTVNLITDNSASGNAIFSGSALITSYSVNSSFDDVIGGSMSFIGALNIDIDGSTGT